MENRVLLFLYEGNQRLRFSLLLIQVQLFSVSVQIQESERHLTLTGKEIYWACEVKNEWFQGQLQSVLHKFSLSSKYFSFDNDNNCLSNPSWHLQLPNKQLLWILNQKNASNLTYWEIRKLKSRIWGKRRCL